MRKRSFLVSLLYLQTLIINSIKPTLAITKPQQHQQQPPFNLSRFLYPILHDDFRPTPSLFLQDVLDSICVSQGWDPADVRVSELEVGSVRYGNVGRYEVSIVQDGKRRREFLFRFSDHKPVKWTKFFGLGDAGNGDFESLADEVSADAVLDAVKIQGPVELRVGGDDRLRLMLPLNSSHSGLRRILVGEGITVEVRSAQEVSLFHSFGFGLRSNKSFVINREREAPWSFGQRFCLSLLPINILGSASVIAYRTQNPDSYIEYKLLPGETIDLLPDKCYVKQTQRNRGFPIDSLKIKMAFLEEVLRILSADKTRQTGLRLLKAKIRVSTVFCFKLELERDIKSNDTLWTKLADWKTRPTIEHAWFEIVARNEAKRLKPVLIKKVRPFVGVETSPWSNLMSNLSFTKIPSVLVPPEAMTLDVKW